MPTAQLTTDAATIAAQSATGSNAVVATSVTILGTAVGLQPDVLLAGFAGGLVSLSFLPPMTKIQRIVAPITATITAAYTAPVAAHWFLSKLPEGADTSKVLVFCAFALGLAAQVALPGALSFLRRKFKDEGGAK